MVSGVSGNSVSAWSNALFSKLDTKNQGYLEKSDLQSALAKVGASGTDSSDGVDELFSQLDGDSDGKVTRSEMSTALSSVADQLDSQFDQSRMRRAGPMHGMGGADDAGFTLDELTNQLDSIGSTDSKRSPLISSLVENFDAADADGDGKITGGEAHAYDEQTRGVSGDISATSNAAGQSSEAQAMHKLMRLLHTYGVGQETSGAASATASLSAIA